jgi:hypothetical protein
VNHGIGLDFRKSLVDGDRVRNVELHVRHRGHGRTVSHTAVYRSHVGADACMAALCKFIHYVVAQLATHTRHKEFHSVNLEVKYSINEKQMLTYVSITQA